MQTNIEITKAFMDAPAGVLSIHQISQKLKLPYGTAYNRIHQLHDLGVVQILPQGKSKLCALNPDNAMSASLLALGAAQATETFISKNGKAGDLLRKMRRTILDVGKNSLSAAILLTPDTVASAAEPESFNNSFPPIEEMNIAELQSENTISLDFFYIQSSPDFNEAYTEQALTSLMTPGYDIRVTSMTVDRDTMLGMFTESENDAGLTAYSMLHGGLVLFGYENFYRIILEAFARRLSIV